MKEILLHRQQKAIQILVKNGTALVLYERHAFLTRQGARATHGEPLLRLIDSLARQSSSSTTSLVSLRKLLTSFIIPLPSSPLIFLLLAYLCSGNNFWMIMTKGPLIKYDVKLMKANTKPLDF